MLSSYTTKYASDEVLKFGDLWYLKSYDILSFNKIGRQVGVSRWPNTPEAIWLHDDVVEWKHFLRYWPFVRGIHRSPVNSPHKGQWRGALIFSLICGWINGLVNNREAGDFGRYRAIYDVIVMYYNSEFKLSMISYDVSFLWRLNCDQCSHLSVVIYTVCNSFIFVFPCKIHRTWS